MIDRGLDAPRLMEALQAAGVKVITTVTGEDWGVHAVDAGGKTYKLRGPDLYEVLLELAEQSGITWDLLPADGED